MLKRHRLLSALIAGMAMSNGAHAADKPQVGPPAGCYIFDGGNGTLAITRAPDTGATFKIDTIGSNAHTCQLQGKVAGDTGVTEGDETPCRLRFVAKPDGVEIVALTPESCRDWCGARAWFAGHYFLPPDSCKPATIATAREEFKKQYQAKAWSEAKALVSPIVEHCASMVFRTELAWIRNDLAVTLHHLKDDAACLRALEPLRWLSETADEDVGAGEPALQDEYRKLAKATRTNLKSCATKPGTRASAPETHDMTVGPFVVRYANDAKWDISYPLIISGPKGQSLAKLKEALARDQRDVVGCDGDPTPDHTFSWTVKAIYADVRFFTVETTFEIYCGGAYPDAGYGYTTYAVMTGEKLSTIGSFKETFGSAQALAIAKAAEPGLEGDLARNEGCDYSDLSNAELAVVEAGLILKPEFAHVQRACELDFKLPWPAIHPFIADTGPLAGRR